MESLTVGGNPLLQLEEKMVEHKTKFTWLFIIMTVVILVLIIAVIWLAATKDAVGATGSTAAVTQGFNSSFNQVDYSGVTGNSTTNETGYNKFAERLVPGNIGAQGFDIDPRNALQKRYDKDFEGGRF